MEIRDPRQQFNDLSSIFFDVINYPKGIWKLVGLGLVIILLLHAIVVYLCLETSFGHVAN